MREFEKRYIYYGVLESDNEKIGDCRCELISNRISQDPWRATISPYGPFDSNRIGKEISFVSTNDNESIRIEGKRPSISFSSDADEILKFDVSKYSRYRKWIDENTEKLFLMFYIPRIGLYDEKPLITRHYKKGLLYGWDEKNRKWKDEEDNQENTIPLKSITGNIQFLPIVVFDKTSINEAEAKLTLDQMAIECEIIKNTDSVFNNQKIVQDEIEDFLIILSLIEGDFINWYYCIGSEHSLAGFPLSEIELFQLAVKIKKTNFDSIRYHRFRKSLQKLHRYLTLLYSQKNVDDKKSIKKLIEKFVIASRTSAVDTRLIYWHSCLDVIIKKCDGKGKSFSHKLIDACKNMNIEWLDIYVGITEESLDLKAEFPLNRIRNEILHDGIYPDDYGEVIKENRNARALCERFITQIIGADYRDTGFGKVDNSYY